MTTANVVFGGPVEVVKPIQIDAAIATGQTIYPGNLVLLSSGEFINHNVAKQGGNYFVADLNFIEQKAVTAALTAGDTATAFVPEPGHIYNLRLTTSQTVVAGDPLTSTGNGTVRKATTNGLEQVLFYAREDVTTTGTVARINARVATAGFIATA
jgi:hypothetical protein